MRPFIKFVSLVLLLLATFILGCFAVIAASRRWLSADPSAWSVQLGALAIAFFFAAALWSVGYLIKRRLFPPAQSQSAGVLDFISNIIPSSVESNFSKCRPGLESLLKDYYESQRVSKTARVLAYLGAFFIAIVGFLVTYAQLQKLTQQTNLLGSQNTIQAVDQIFQQERDRAAQRFQQVSTVLLNPDSPPHLQQFALQEVIDAMLIEVPRAEFNSAAGPEPKMVYDLPNLDRLRKVLLQYMRTDRVSHALAKSGKKLKPTDFFFEDESVSIEAFAPVSDELLHTLHRLGPTDPDRPAECLWRWTPPRNGIPSDQLFTIPKVRPPLEPQFAVQDRPLPILELTHFSGTDLVQLCLPYALQQERRWRLDLRKMDLSGANLMHGSFSHCDFRGITLEGARLDSAWLGSAQLAGANLQRAKMFRTDMVDADMQGVSLQSARLAGANLNGACLLAANLSGSFDLVDFSQTCLVGAKFEHGNFLADNAFQESKLAGLKFENASAFLARFEDCDFRGASFRHSSLFGCAFIGCNLSGVDFRNAHLHGGEHRIGNHAPEKDFPIPFIADPEDGRTYPTLFLPGLLIENCLMNLEATFVHVHGFSGTELLAKLSPQLAKEFDTLNEEIGAELPWREWLPYLDAAAVERIPLPEGLSTLMKKDIGDDHIRTEPHHSLLLAYGPGREFLPEEFVPLASRPVFDATAFEALNAILNSQAQRESLLRDIEEARKFSKNPDRQDLPTPESLIAEAKKRLYSTTNHPGGTLGIFQRELDDRKDWPQRFPEQYKAAMEKVKAAKPKLPEEKTR